MKKAVNFQFLYPITDVSELPPVHIGDLAIYATCYLQGDGSLHMDDDEQPEVEVEIRYGGLNITNLLDVIAPDTVFQVRQAAKQAALNHDDYTEDAEAESGEGKSEDFGKWMHNEAERTIFNND